mmetsp:Transcript_602/g.1411  ORF Transcript_602/g.1411 Transcript_602/m.1411 type:complete len:216 (+) Transcript_602:806-1453(+)
MVARLTPNQLDKNTVAERSHKLPEEEKHQHSNAVAAKATEHPCWKTSGWTSSPVVHCPVVHFNLLSSIHLARKRMQLVVFKVGCDLLQDQCLGFLAHPLETSVDLLPSGAAVAFQKDRAVLQRPDALRVGMDLVDVRVDVCFGLHRRELHADVADPPTATCAGLFVEASNGSAASFAHNHASAAGTVQRQGFANVCCSRRDKVLDVLFELLAIIL